MALRNFTDSAGLEWRVWNVVPERASRSDDGFTPGLEGGWLCFENDEEKRRLCPIPGDWEQADASALEQYCEAARSVARRNMAHQQGAAA